MASKTEVKWLDKVGKDDFEAGERYLCLLYPDAASRKLIRSLKSARTARFAAKDILRASELALAPQKDPDVTKQSKKIAKGQALSPLLLIRESGHARLIVADGFHRLCAVHHIDEETQVPCKIA